MNNEPDLITRKELIDIYNSKRFARLFKKISDLQKSFPFSIFLLNLAGSAHNELKNYYKAVEYFEKIKEINSNFSDAYYNLGIVYKTIDQIDKSIENYIECIKINPSKYQAYNNLGNIYKDQRKIEMAIKNYLICLEINPEYFIALQNFGICLQNFKFSKSSLIAEKHIIRLLNQNKILRPVDIIDTLIKYIYLDNNFNNFIGNFQKIKNLLSFEKKLKKFYSFKILINLLEVTPITDLKIEKFLRYLRSEILLNLTRIKNKKIALGVIMSIASQCFINEYIYPIKKNENEALKKIENKINEFKKEKPEDYILEICTLASYQPLNSYKWSNKILNLKEIIKLTTQQIINQKKEKKIKRELYKKKIEDKISLKVQNQYEENPYPRWEQISLNTIPAKPINFLNNLKLKVDVEKISNWDDINILVAGCGTGQHAITTATKYEKSFVTAIDLSLNSLSFAKRKSEELEIRNIEFIQMDLLDLKNYGRKFNIIESVGVLHHMSDPYLGWKELYNSLKTDGLIMIGLYSRLAREHIKKIRNKINKNKIVVNNNNIINLREEIIFSKEKYYELIKASPDFYSLSNLRDLLLHVEEHTFDLKEIKLFLDKLNLKFCGFENRELLNLFKQVYKKHDDIYNLDLWNEFEINNPRIFAGMYQFWCQKIDSIEI